MDTFILNYTGDKIAQAVENALQIDEKVETVRNDISTELKNVEELAKNAQSIAKGRATGYVFDTKADMDSWLADSDNVTKLVLGDNLYIRDLGVPDYWWDTKSNSAYVLETQKVDLTEYAKKSTTLSGYGIEDAYTKDESKQEFQDKLTDEQLANIADVPNKADKYVVDDILGILPDKQNKLTDEQLANIADVPNKADKDVVNSILNDLKNKSIPNNNVSDYPISVTDHLKNENALGYKIFGNSVQAETPTLDNPIEVISLGDLITEGEYSGKYKIPVIVCGKNMFNVNEYFPEFVNDENGISYTQSDFFNIYQVKILKDRFKANTQYTLSCTVELSNCDDNSVTIQMFSTSDTVLKYETFKITTTEPQTKEITITNPSNTSVGYVRIVYGTSMTNCNVKISNIQIEEGNTATNFESYVGSTIHIYLNEPLRKLGNVSDYVDYKRGKIVRKVKEYIFSGKEYWINLVSGSTTYYAQSLPGALYAENVYCLCSKFKGGVSGTGSTHGDGGMCWFQNVSTYPRFYVSFDSEKTTTEIKELTNGMKLYYVLAEQTEEDIELPIITISNSDSVSINTDTKVKASSIELVYYQDINKVLLELKNAIIAQGGNV